MSEITVVEGTDFAVANYFDAEFIYTPYKVRNIVNQILADLGIDKELPGPMFYTYAKKGYIGGVKDAKRIKGADAIEWTQKYIIKHFSA